MVDITEEVPEIKQVDDPFAYLQRDFSSEKFKIEVKSLPKHYGINELKKLLKEKLKLAFNKIKQPRQNSPYLFICFRNEEDRDAAIKTLTGFKWKGRNLTAIKANPAPDPLIKKRKQDEEDTVNKKVKVDDRSLLEQMKDSIIPLWSVDYKDQLDKKQEAIKIILKKYGNYLQRQNPELRGWMRKQKEKFDGLPCELLDIRSSDIEDGYRNKCEFTVGINEETNLPTVGFRMGRYTSGNVGVGPVDDLKHVPNSMKIAVKHYENFVRTSDLGVYQVETETGHFKQLVARSTKDQLMLIFGVHPQELDEEAIKKLKHDVVKYFTEGPGSEAKVTSMYYQTMRKKERGERLDLEHLHGDTHIYETILGLRFRISPEAFFQINTAGAEILYKSAIELASPSDASTVVDICCGTGAIGLCFAKSCSQVLGLEMTTQAVEDARINAKINDIENIQFFDGKAEEILTGVFHYAKNDDVIGIVDPPRAGLHQKALVQLRKEKRLKKLVYISCDPQAASKNFVDLGRPMSKTLQEEPFVPIKAVAVDMFPHTNHCELVLYFERWDTVDKTVADA